MTMQSAGPWSLGNTEVQGPAPHVEQLHYLARVGASSSCMWQIYRSDWGWWWGRSIFLPWEPDSEKLSPTLAETQQRGDVPHYIVPGGVLCAGEM